MKDRNGIELKVGHICKVYPTTSSTSDRWNRYKHTGNFFTSSVQHPYYVEIIPTMASTLRSDICDIMTNIPGKHSAWINSYLLSKMEVVGTKETHEHLLFNQFEDQEIKIEEQPFAL